VVDNMHRGGLAAPVEIGTGVLGVASGYATAGSAGRHTHHPVSGGAIEGRRLPMWEQARELACQAHRAFPPRLLVGWDIAVTPTGPVLVEGNEQPGVDGLQRLHNLALGEHRFGELLAFHLGNGC
jgi:glutathione synthase/RimK-type ligase-like ATP-grasp enzyme